ncbi:MAG: LytTR family transcriptional regulator [Firmicutes bacterium]|nr:LytTR family transcriptional regulator [Bacillota bacterium]
MEIEIKIDPACKAPKLVVVTAEVTEEIEGLVEQLSRQSDDIAEGEAQRLLTGTRDGMVCLIEPENLIRIYAASGRVFGVTEEGEYVLRRRLYELEEQLDSHRFVRISNSEIVNLKQVLGFDLRFTGTICVKLSDGTSTYVSRRYVSKIKKILG